MKKTVWLLCLVLCFSAFTSCRSNPSTIVSSSITSSETSSVTSEAEQERIFSLAYFANDSFNPYSANQSTNFYLGSLLYDSLVKVKNDFSVENVMADSISFEDNVCTVTLKKGLKFSDGSDVTVGDVVSSVASAKSSSRFSKRLDNVLSCKAKDGAVVFTLKKIDRNFAKNLTFPIIKGGSKQSKAIGSGRFRFATENTSDGLVKNEYNTLRKTNIESISLTQIHKYSTLPYMVKIGSVNFLYANLDSSLNFAASSSSAVLMNNLVYLGVNSNNALLANQDFRKAVSLCVNRKNILTDAYAGAGFATAAPFHPKASGLNSKDYSIALNDASAAGILLGTCGYTQKNENGIFMLDETAEMRLRLAVNSENTARKRAAQSVKLNLEAAGIGVDIIEESADAYKVRIASGDYDLFIGEVKLTADNDISSLLSPGSLNAVNDEGATLLAYNQYLAGEITLEDFLRTFDLKTPFIPILYRNGTAFFSATLNGNQTVTEYDVFAAMDKWEF
ncbi:MAG: hypothetical protein IJ370_02920 [Oscillospiraceae bacterium]|nr:hypothetical protein [Oscillospiraceae bacterium]